MVAAGRRRADPKNELASCKILASTFLPIISALLIARPPSRISLERKLLNNLGHASILHERERPRVGAEHVEVRVHAQR